MLYNEPLKSFDKSRTLSRLQASFCGDIAMIVRYCMIDVKRDSLTDVLVSGHALELRSGIYTVRFVLYLSRQKYNKYRVSNFRAAVIVLTLGQNALCISGGLQM